MSKPVSRATATWEVLRSVWALNRKLAEEGRTYGASIAEVMDHLLTIRTDPIKYVSVATHLRELEARDLVVSEKRGRKFYYRPVISELAAVSAEIREFLDRIIHNEPELMDELQRQLSERRHDQQVRERQAQKRRSQAS